MRGLSGQRLAQPSPRKRGEGVIVPVMSTIVRTLDEALAPIADGCMLAVARESSGVAMAATRALVRRGVKRLHLVTLPTSSLQADLLIGAGGVETLDTSGVSLGEFGPAPRFSSAIIVRCNPRAATPLARRYMRSFRPPRRACRSCRCAASSAPTCWLTGPIGRCLTIRSAMTIRSCCCRR